MARPSALLIGGAGRRETMQSGEGCWCLRIVGVPLLEKEDFQELLLFIWNQKAPKEFYRQELISPHRSFMR